MALGLLEVWADAETAYADIPGVSMAVVHGQDLLWRRGFGFADRAREAEASADTYWPNGSIPSSRSREALKKFSGMTVGGEGDLVTTFLLPGQAPKGEKVP